MSNLYTELDLIINQIEDEDLSIMAAVGLLIEARDRQVLCVACDDPRFEVQVAAGYSTCEGEGWYPYCKECLTVLERYERVSWWLEP